MPAGVGTDLANTVPSAARISPRALSERFAATRGLLAELLQRLALDQLDVHQLHDDQAEADDHDDAQPSDASSHQCGGRRSRQSGNAEHAEHGRARTPREGLHAHDVGDRTGDRHTHPGNAEFQSDAQAGADAVRQSRLARNPWGSDRFRFGTRSRRSRPVGIPTSLRRALAPIGVSPQTR